MGGPKQQQVRETDMPGRQSSCRKFYHEKMGKGGEKEREREVKTCFPLQKNCRKERARLGGAYLLNNT